MKLNLKNNTLWERENRTKRKKARTRVHLIAAFIILLSALVLADVLYREKVGAYYPDILLFDTAAGKEPEVRVAPGHDKILKFPNMAYTLAIKGTVTKQEEESCELSLDSEMRIRIMDEEKGTDTHTSLIQKIWPADGKTTYQEYHPKKGYLNEREVETVCCTIKSEGETYYSMLYRISLEDKDALLFGYTKNKARLAGLKEELEDLFYTLHAITEKQAEAMLEEPAKSLTAIGEDGQQEEYYLETEEGYGTDGLGVAETPKEGYNGLRDIPKDAVYVSEMEETIAVEEDTEDLYVVFQYTNTQTPLTAIQMDNPEGNRYVYPDHSYDGFYTFHTENAEEGIWTLRFSADQYIGYYFVSVFNNKETFLHYIDSQSVMYAIPTGDFENGS